MSDDVLKAVRDLPITPYRYVKPTDGDRLIALATAAIFDDTIGEGETLTIEMLRDCMAKLNKLDEIDRRATPRETYTQALRRIASEEDE